MKKYSLHFLGLSLLTGILGFALGNYTGVLYIRILFVVVADLFLVSLLAKALFYKKNTQQLKAEKVQNK